MRSALSHGVIPAQDGIQIQYHKKLSGRIVCNAINQAHATGSYGKSVWIPACAGMTLLVKALDD